MPRTTQSTQLHNPIMQKEVAIVGVGPNALRLLACLKDYGDALSVTAFERQAVGNTITQWYEGSISHSPRNTFQVGQLQPLECRQCLESVYTAQQAPRDAAQCALDQSWHCGRDEYLAYLRRAVRHYRLDQNIHEHEEVLGVEPLRRRSDSATRFRLSTAARTYHPGAVVLAFGAASNPKPFALPTAAGAGSALSTSFVLGPARLYHGRHVVVLGSGPSGMEAAVRLCSPHYRAAQVTLATRSGNLMQALNAYTNESLWRIHAFEAQGRLTRYMRAVALNSNGSHLTLRLGSPLTHGSMTDEGALAPCTVAAA